MNKLVNILLKKQKYKNPPIWIMRQAGRYLPEYRRIRKNVKNFLELCYDPNLSSEVTLQPINRFKFDAAIIFSDILVIPHSLGINVEFIKGQGPKLEKITKKSDLNLLKKDNIKNFLEPIYKNINITRSKLDSKKDLIGFSGSPWTLACYMIEGGGSKNFDLTRRKALEDGEFFAKLIEILTNSIIQHLKYQIKAGVNIVKLFDSWASILPQNEIEKWVIEPSKKIVQELKKDFPKVPIICFPRGIGLSYEKFVKEVKCDAIALDQNIDRKWARDILQQKLGTVIQGNLDNYLLAFGKKSEIKKEAEDILDKFNDGNFIFNLGHGILPKTPIENVELLLEIVRGDGS